MTRKSYDYDFNGQTIFDFEITSHFSFEGKSIEPGIIVRRKMDGDAGYSEYRVSTQFST